MIRRSAHALTASVVALCGLGYLGVLLAVPGSPVAIVVDDVGNLLSPLTAAAACALAARRCHGRLSLSWALLAASAFTWAGGQAAWCWFELGPRGAVPFPGPPDVGYLLAVPLAVTALLVHPQAPRPVSGRLRLLGDGVLVGASLLSAAWRVALQSTYADVDFRAAQLLGLAYPLLDVVLLTVVVLLLARANRATAVPLLLVAGWVSAGTAGHLVYGALAQSGGWSPGGPVDAAWGLGFLLLAGGAAAQRSLREDDFPVRRHSTLRTCLPYLPVALAVLATVVDRLRGAPIDGVAGSLLIVVVTVAGARQLTAMLENGRLTHDLESVVAERTAQLLELAQTDPLTGLPNRALLATRTAAALVDGHVAVALLDLDGFKAVNDSLGHEAGDGLLCQVADRLAAATHPGETVGRLGGDEFAVVLPGVRTQQQALAAADRLLLAATGTALADGREVLVVASLGVVLARPGDTPADLLRNADVAMYAAKELAPRRREGGRGSRMLFEPSMREAVLRRLDLESELREALARGEIVPHFQPVIDLRTGALRGVEALARWVRPDGVAVPPSVFVPLAEQCGLDRRPRPARPAGVVRGGGCLAPGRGRRSAAPRPHPVGERLRRSAGLGVPHRRRPRRAGRQRSAERPAGPGDHRDGRRGGRRHRGGPPRPAQAARGPGRARRLRYRLQLTGPAAATAHRHPQDRPRVRAGGAPGSA